VGALLGALAIECAQEEMVRRPVFINSVEDAERYFLANSITAEPMSPFDSELVLNTIDQAIERVFALIPASEHKPRTVQAAGYRWSVLHMPNRATIETWRVPSWRIPEWGSDQVAVLFEDLDTAFLTRRDQIAQMSDTDVYVIPWPSPTWLFAMSHEGEEYGPYFVDLSKTDV
jgi:hypothetical protein